MANQRDPVGDYARRVLSGKILAGRPVRLACQRHIDDLKRKDLKWCPAEALEKINFFPDLLTFEDEKPFELQDFQKFIIGSIFGWFDTKGRRRFRTAYIEIGKGNGKTPLAAGVGLIGLVADREPAPEIYSAAATRDQASICFKDAKGMVERSEELSGLVAQNVGSLTIESEFAVFRPVSAEHRGLDGKRPHMGLIDELHEHSSAIVVDKIRAGTKRRKNALIFEITNSGYDRQSVCWKHHDYSLKILEGVLENDNWFAYVAALDEKDDWRDPKIWIKANPGLGTILPAKYLEEQVKEAIGMPSKENIVRRLNFCEWTEQSVRWLSMPVWDKGAQPIFDPASLRGRKCFGGLDLARVRDLSALALAFPPMEALEKWKLLCWFWLPKDDMLIRSQRDHVDYDVWVRNGLIKVTPGNTTDFSFIEADVLALSRDYDVREIAFDRTFAGEIVTNLQGEGLVMVEFGQGFLSMMSPTAEFERMVLGNELLHNGHPVLRWNASNVAVQQDAAGNIKPDKEHSTEKIDGIVAAIMAIGRAKVNTEEAKSIYETDRPQGLLTL